MRLILTRLIAIITDVIMLSRFPITSRIGARALHGPGMNNIFAGRAGAGLKSTFCGLRVGPGHNRHRPGPGRGLVPRFFKLND